MAGTGCNTSNNPIRHGHTGNRKNHLVYTRPPKAERIEKREFGLLNVDEWQVTHPMTCKRAYDFAAKWERYGYEVRIKTTNQAEELMCVIKSAMNG